MKLTLSLVLAFSLGLALASPGEDAEVTAFLNKGIDGLLEHFNEFIPQYSYLKAIYFNQKVLFLTWSGWFQANSTQYNSNVQRNGSCEYYPFNNSDRTSLYVPLYSNGIELTVNYTLSFGWFTRYGKITISTKPVSIAHNSTFQNGQMVRHIVNVGDVRPEIITTTYDWTTWPFNLAWKNILEPLHDAIAESVESNLKEAVEALISKVQSQQVKQLANY